MGLGPGCRLHFENRPEAVGQPIDPFRRLRAASQRCPVEIAGRVHDEAASGINPIGVAGEAMQQSFIAARIELENSAVIGRAPGVGRAVEISGGVAKDGPDRIRPVRRSAEAMEHRQLA